MAATTPPDLPVHRFAGADGAALAYRELGEGTPLVLIHGLFSNGWTNWIRYGHAARLAEAGFRVIMPDLRGHGDSAAPHDPAAYPPDVLADDGLALVRHLSLDRYALAGYSLGGRACVRMLARGAAPVAVVLSGMGLEGLVDSNARVGHFRAVLTGIGRHPRGSAEWMAEAFLKTTGGDPQALLPLLDSFVDTDRATLAAIERPVLVLTGEDDRDNGSAEALAAALPDARYEAIPGNHMSAVLKPDLGEAMARFLSRYARPA
ncbi:MAG: alpha/beta fold hydrolase [Sphingomonas fennica]